MREELVTEPDALARALSRHVRDELAAVGVRPVPSTGASVVNGYSATLARVEMRASDSSCVRQADERSVREA